jgi:hypothetical protein
MKEGRGEREGKGTYFIHRPKDFFDVLKGLRFIHFQFCVQLVDLVHEQHGFHSLGPGLPQHHARLDADALYRIDHYDTPVREAKGGRNLGRKIHVTGRIDEIYEIPSSVREIAYIAPEEPLSLYPRPFFLLSFPFLLPLFLLLFPSRPVLDNRTNLFSSSCSVF